MMSGEWIMEVTVLCTAGNAGKKLGLMWVFVRFVELISNSYRHAW